MNAVEDWEARTQVDIGVMIARYIAEHPCPGPSRHPNMWTDWSTQLREAGQVVGVRRLHAVDMGAS